MTVTGSTQTSVTVSWTASNDNVGVSGYDLFRNGVSVGTTTATSRTFSSLSCGTSYTLGVDAYDAAHNTSSLSTVSASTSACPDTQAPTAPSNFLVTGSTTSSISVSWNPSFDNVSVSGYDLYVGSTLAGTATALNVYTFAGLTCGTSYTLAVDAYDPSGNKSTKASLTTSTAACPPALVTFNSPAAGATVSGSIVWSVQPTVAFNHVDFLIDGTVKWTESSCPCEFNGDPNGRLDTTTLANGNHVLKASAYNASGTKVAESSETVTVSNAPPTTTTTPPPTTTTPPPTTTTPPPTTTTAPSGSCTTTISSGLQSAITNASGGAVICLTSGTYTGFTLSNVSKSSDVTVEPAPGANVTITNGIDLNAVNHLRITGVSGSLTMQGGDVDPSSSSCSKNVTLDHITYTFGVNVHVGCSSQNVVLDSDRFDNLPTNVWEGRVNVVGGGNPAGVTISNSHFSGGCSDGIDVLGPSGVQIGPGNEFTNLQQGGCSEHVDPIALSEAPNLVITGNYFHDNGDGSGGFMGGMPAPNDSSGAVVTDNVFACTCQYPYSIFAGGAKNYTIRHNTFAGGGLVRFEIDNGWVPTGNLVRDNVFTAGGGISLDSSSSGYGSNDHNLNAGKSGTADITGTPVFVGGAKPTSYSGYGLAAGSPGKGAASDGTDVGISP